METGLNSCLIVQFEFHNKFELKNSEFKINVKRKSTNKTLVQKCEIIRHIEKGMTNKEASERFGVLKNTISTWIKNKEVPERPSSP